MPPYLKKYSDGRFSIHPKFYAVRTSTSAQGDSKWIYRSQTLSCVWLCLDTTLTLHAFFLQWAALKHTLYCSEKKKKKSAKMKKKVRYKRKEVTALRWAFFQNCFTGRIETAVSSPVHSSVPEWTVFLETVSPFPDGNYLPSPSYQISPETQDFLFLEKYCISPALLVKISLKNSLIRIFPEGRC